MNKAKENLIKIMIVIFLVWLILFVVALAIDNKTIISNVFFGIAVVLLFPILYVFFKNKRLKFTISQFEVENYLTTMEWEKLKENESLLKRKVQTRQAIYLVSFSLFNALVFIGSAFLVLYL